MGLRKKVDLILGWVLIVVMALMVINVLWQICSRYILGSPSSFTDELARYLMIWVGLLGGAYVSGKKMHVAINAMTIRFGKKARQRFSILVDSMIFLFALFALGIGGCRLVYISYLLEQRSPALQVPLALVYAVLPISGLLIVFYKFDDLFVKDNA